MKLLLIITLVITQFFCFAQTKTNSKVAKEYFINKYPNGKKEAEGNYVNGKEQGKWTFWHAKRIKEFLLQVKEMENIQAGTQIKM